MTPLDFSMEPSFECAEDDSGDIAFVHVMGLIGSQDMVEEYLSCGMFPLSANFSFLEIADGETRLLKVALPLLEFSLTKLQGESNNDFLARVELDEDMPFTDSTTFSWSDTKTLFKYDKLILMFFYQLF
jgi:hypothetical protein